MNNSLIALYSYQITKQCSTAVLLFLNIIVCAYIFHGKCPTSILQYFYAHFLLRNMMLNPKHIRVKLIAGKDSA